jgi:hypothetical protein
MNKLVSAPAKAAAFLHAVVVEYKCVREEHGDVYHSAHEGWAVMLEEVDELWDEVRKKRKNRDPRSMYKECVQIACCALKFAVSFGKE